jgi:hypothetical protein
MQERKRARNAHAAAHTRLGPAVPPVPVPPRGQGHVLRLGDDVDLVLRHDGDAAVVVAGRGGRLGRLGGGGVLGRGDLYGGRCGGLCGLGGGGGGGGVAVDAAYEGEQRDGGGERGRFDEGRGRRGGGGRGDGLGFGLVGGRGQGRRGREGRRSAGLGRGSGGLGRGGAGVDIAAADGLDDEADVDGCALRRQRLALVWRAGEGLGLARVVHGLALVVPQLAHGAARRGCRGPARLSLRPAVLARRPAPGLVRVRGDFLAAPVCALGDAGLGHETLGLLRLRDGGEVGIVGEVCDGGAGDLVLRVVAHVDVERDRGLAGAHVVRAGDGDGALGDQAAGALEEDLRTARVELGGAVGGIVQRDDLRTGEVVAAFEALGELHGEAAVVVDEAVGAPFVGVGVVAVVHELEPAVASALVVNGGGDFLQVDGAGAVVASVQGLFGRVVGPGAHLEGQGGPVFDRVDEADTFGSIDVCLG